MKRYIKLIVLCGVAVAGSYAQSLTQPNLSRAITLATTGSNIAYIGCPITPILPAVVPPSSPIAMPPGTLLNWTPNVNGAGGATTINVCALGSVSLKEADGTTDPTNTDIVASKPLFLIWDGVVFRMMYTPGSGGGSVGPAGPPGPFGPETGAHTVSYPVNVATSYPTGDLNATIVTNGTNVVLTLGLPTVAGYAFGILNKNASTSTCFASSGGALINTSTTPSYCVPASPTPAALGYAWSRCIATPDGLGWDCGLLSGPAGPTGPSGGNTAIPVLISTSGAVADPGGVNYYQINNASGGLTFNAPAGAAGYQRCYRNATGKTGAITIQMATSNTVDLGGTNGSAAGTLVSGGAAGDSLCIVGDATNHWYAYKQSGTWTNN